MRILTCLLSAVLLLNSFTAAFAQPFRAPSQREMPQINPQLLVNTFYQNKAKAAMQDVKTYRARYNAVAFYSYPRTFWEDVIPALPPYNVKGELFKQSLKDTYESLNNQAAPDVNALAAQTVKEITLNPRRVNVAKSIPMPKAGDIWHNAFYMASFYIQIGDYAEKIRSEKKLYNEYKKYVANNDAFMFEPYKNYDFTIARYNPSVFYKRMADIESFVKSYTAQANGFIRKTLAPLQVEKVPAADVRKYLENSLSSQELPAGLSKQNLINVITEQIPPAQEFYNKAAQVNPSFYGQVSSLYTILANTTKAKWDDVTNSLSMFEYISPGTLIERLDAYGKIPSRQQVLDELASSFAAEALNKSLAQISNDLFEFEKPFYYSDVSFRSAEGEIVKNWHSISTNAFFGDKMIGKIASDNILNSGKRAYQDAKLLSAINSRRIQENTNFYKTALPIAIDFAAGDAAFMLVTPIFKTGRLATAVKQKALTSSLKNLKYDRTAAEALSATKAAKGAQKLDVASLKHVKSHESFERAVWEIRNSQGEITSYFKYGSRSELERTKQIDKIIKDNNLIEKYNLIEIEYPKIISEGTDAIPASLKPQLQRDFDKIYTSVRDVKKRTTTPFITQRVDISGFTIVDLNAKKGSNALQLLNNQPINQKEWKQVVEFYADLNRNGFYHTDVWHNLHLSRTPQGKLKITLIDFEHMNVADMDELEDFERILKTLKLKEKKGNGYYYPEFGSKAAKLNYDNRYLD